MTEHVDSDIESYKAMAADTEREQEASEWCNAYFSPASPAECAKVERRVREYHKNPQSFVPLKDIR